MGLLSRLGERRAAREERKRREAEPPAPPYLGWIEHYTFSVDDGSEPVLDAESARKVS